jgi:predicted molibdopterin-dependent oxidoreductase YjgC
MKLHFSKVKDKNEENSFIFINFEKLENINQFLFLKLHSFIFISANFFLDG